MIPVDFPTDGYGKDQPIPSRLPGATEDHRGPRHHAQRLFAEAVNTLAATPTTGLDEAAQHAADLVTSRLANIRQHSYVATGELDKLASNDLLPEQGKARLVSERRQELAQAVDIAAAESDLGLTLLTSALVEAAMPAMPEGADTAGAREEFRMIMDASEDPVTTFTELATGGDERLGAVATGTYGINYLTRVRKVEPRVVAALRQQAALAVPDTASSVRRAAAEHLRTTVPALTKARALALQAAAMAAES